MMAWDHWWSGDVKMDNETEKRFIKFAGQMGFPYQLVDWQWYGEFNQPGADITRPAPQLNFPELLKFASEQHVRLWLWLHSGDVNRALNAGTLDEPQGLVTAMRTAAATSSNMIGGSQASQRGGR